MKTTLLLIWEFISAMLISIFGVVLGLPIIALTLLILPLFMPRFLKDGPTTKQHYANSWMIFKRYLVDLLPNFTTPIGSLIGLLMNYKQLDTLEDRNLPLSFWFWDNYKDPLGDKYWKGEDHSKGHYKELIWRYRWLMRNRCNYFEYSKMGWMTSENSHYTVYGDLSVSDRPRGKSGILYIEGRDEFGAMFPSYYIIQRWGSLNFCLRIYLGWKNKNRRKDGTPEQFVTVFAPFVTFKE